LAFQTARRLRMRASGEGSEGRVGRLARVSAAVQEPPPKRRAMTEAEQGRPGQALKAGMVRGRVLR